MDMMSKGERTNDIRGKGSQETRPSQRIYTAPKGMELITPSPSTGQQNTDSPSTPQHWELSFVKPRSSPDSGAKNARNNDTQDSKRDASNSPPASVKKMPQAPKELSSLKFTLEENRTKVMGHLWGYVDDVKPEVDIYHVRINTSAIKIGTLSTNMVRHMKLAYSYAMANDHVETWEWKTRFTDSTGDTLPKDMFATFVIGKTNKEMSQGVATPMMTQKGGKEGHHTLTNAELSVPEDGAKAVDDAMVPARTATGNTRTHTSVTDEGSDDHHISPNAKMVVPEGGATDGVEEKAGTALGTTQTHLRGVFGKGVNKTSALPDTGAKDLVGGATVSDVAKGAKEAPGHLPKTDVRDAGALNNGAETRDIMQVYSHNVGALNNGAATEETGRMNDRNAGALNNGADTGKTKRGDHSRNRAEVSYPPRDTREDFPVIGGIQERACEQGFYTSSGTPNPPDVYNYSALNNCAPYQGSNKDPSHPQFADTEGEDAVSSGISNEELAQQLGATRNGLEVANQRDSSLNGPSARTYVQGNTENKKNSLPLRARRVRPVHQPGPASAIIPPLTIGFFRTGVQAKSYRAATSGNGAGGGQQTVPQIPENMTIHVPQDSNVRREVYEDKWDTRAHYVLKYWDTLDIQSDAGFLSTSMIRIALMQSTHASVGSMNIATQDQIYMGPCQEYQRLLKQVEKHNNVSPYTDHRDYYNMLNRGLGYEIRAAIQLAGCLCIKQQISLSDGIERVLAPITRSFLEQAHSHPLLSAVLRKIDGYITKEKQSTE
jgi:hypothetical protein